MLINYSNHPSTKWTETQLNAASESYEKIRDMAFPIINPLASEDELNELVEHQVDAILKFNPKAVHIMGEMTFTFRLVSKLKELNIPCVASTTERKVVEVGDQKISTFDFVQFRNY